MFALFNFDFMTWVVIIFIGLGFLMNKAAAKAKEAAPGVAKGIASGFLESLLKRR